MKPEYEKEFEQFVRMRRSELLRASIALTAGDLHLAEDLVQATLVRLYVAWRRVRRFDNIAGYARKVLANSFIDHTRRPFVRREDATDRLPDYGYITAHQDGLDSDLLTALAQLPARMRAAVVLRFVDDLSVEETAQALGCSEGTVKSQTSRGLDKIRAFLQSSGPLLTRASV